MTALTADERASFTRAIIRRSGGQISVPLVPMDRAEAIALWRDVVAAFGHSTSRTLLPRELASLRARAWRQSAGYVAHRGETMTLSCALAFWRAAIRIGAVAERRGQGPVRRGLVLAAAGLAATQLAACTSFFGGNIKGSFACSAPGGTCAPSTLIDDQALSVIQNARPLVPGEAYPGPAARRPAAARVPIANLRPTNSGRLSATEGGMVHRERRVLRVVFPSFVDGSGNLHEPRIIHAVVDDGAWMQLSSGELTIGEEIEGRAVSLAQASDVGRRPTDAPVEPDSALPAPVLVPEASGLPSPAAVAAARAKARGPASGQVIDAIRAEVQSRLAETAKAPGRGSPAPITATDAPRSAAHDAAPELGGTKTAPATGPTAFPGKVEE